MSAPLTGHDEAKGASGSKAGQRRQVTVLFADMAGYTALAEKLGEEQTYLLMQRVHRALNEAVHAQEGTVQEITGDGVMALFGAPIAIEDAPLRACLAALDIQARMAVLTGGIDAGSDVRPAFRVGIHSGPLVVGEVGDERKSGITALGDTVNLASRIESEAGVGQIVLSEATHALVEGFVESVFIGERSIKGKTEPQKLWRLDAVRQGVTRFDVAKNRGLTPLIGRRLELETLENLWKEACTGSVRAVTIAGEPGIGKSRLVHELRQRIGDERTFILEGHCSANSRGIPFAPLIEVVRKSFRIADGAKLPEARRKLTQGLEMLGLNAEKTLPYLLNLLGFPDAENSLESISGETLGIRTRDAIAGMLRERCRISPTLMIIDGMQWADSATCELIGKVVENAEELPLLVVTTARTGFEAPWSGSRNAADMRLAPLSEGATVELLKANLGVDNLPDGLAKLVAGKSQGNPLFTEEIADFLRNNGAIRPDGETVAFDGGKAGTILSVTVENLLMDRFDKLEEGPRTVLETAAVIGPRFANELVASATGLGDETAGHLDELVRLELIRAEPGGKAHSFRHAMARDAIYDSLLTPRKQTLHERVAKAIEKKHAGYPDEAANLLAHHWSHTSHADKAVAYLALAGESALRIYSLEEAEANFRRALELIEAHPGQTDKALLADILLDIARVLYFQGEFFAIIDLVEPYLPQVEALGDKKRLSRFLFETGYAHVFASKVERGRELLDRARELGRETGDDLGIAYADLGAMWDRMFWGEPGEERHKAQREAAERLVEVGRRHGDIWLASKAQLALGLDLQAWGRPGEGRAELMKLMAMSRETNDPRPRAMALWALATLDTYGGNYAEAIEYADEALRLSLSPIDRNSALAYKAMSMVLSGQVDEGMELGIRLHREAREKGLAMVMAVPNMVMGMGTLMQGHMARGMRLIEDAVREGQDWGQTDVRAFGDLSIGETYLQMAIADSKPPLSVILRNLPFLVRTLPFAASKARSHLENALNAFRHTDRPSYVARSLYDLALTDKADKKPDEARSKLAEAREIAMSVEAESLVRDIDAVTVPL